MLQREQTDEGELDAVPDARGPESPPRQPQNLIAIFEKGHRVDKDTENHKRHGDETETKQETKPNCDL